MDIDANEVIEALGRDIARLAIEKAVLAAQVSASQRAQNESAEGDA